MAVATYLITGKTATGARLINVNIAGIDQDEEIVEEVDVVHAVRDFLQTLPGITQATCLKFEQVTTQV